MTHRMTEEEIEHRFTYHKPDDEKAQLHATVRGLLMEAALDLNEILPDSDDPERDEKERAIKRLEDVMFLANAAIARHRDEPEAERVGAAFVMQMAKEMQMPKETA